MKALIDGLLVGAALLTSSAYLYKALGPRALKSRVAAQLTALAARAPSFYGLRGLLTGLAAASATMSAGSCGGCDGCGPGPAANAAAAEVLVPLAAIGKRGSPRGTEPRY